MRGSAQKTLICVCVWVCVQLAACTFKSMAYIIGIKDAE